MLVLPNRDVWTFEAYDQRVELEESVYLAAPHGPRRTEQIVIHGDARGRAAHRLVPACWSIRSRERRACMHEQAEAAAIRFRALPAT